VLPWYPLLSFGPKLAWHLAHRLLPGGRERLIRRGLRARQAYLDVLFGHQRQELTQPLGAP